MKHAVSFSSLKSQVSLSLPCRKEWTCIFYIYKRSQTEYSIKENIFLYCIMTYDYLAPRSARRRAALRTVGRTGTFVRGPTAVRHTDATSDPV